MQCSDCGYQLSPFDKDCPRCKTMSIKGTKPPTPPPIKLNFDDHLIDRIEETKLKCANCNNPLECGWLACPKCGTQFEAPVPQLSPGKSEAASGPVGKQSSFPSNSHAYAADPLGIAINQQSSSAQQVVTKDDGNSSSGSSNRLARVLVSVALLFIGVPGVISGASMIFSTPAADSKANQDAADPAAHHEVNQTTVEEIDKPIHTIGVCVFLLSSAFCIPGIILLIGNGKPNPPRPSTNS